MSELKPCPFCGGDAEITRYGTSRYSTQYECTDCGCQLETGETFNHGEAWNTRDTDQLIAEACDKQNKAIEIGLEITSYISKHSYANHYYEGDHTYSVELSATLEDLLDKFDELAINAPAPEGE